MSISGNKSNQTFDRYHDLGPEEHVKPANKALLFFTNSMILEWELTNQLPPLFATIPSG